MPQKSPGIAKGVKMNYGVRLLLLLLLTCTAPPGIPVDARSVTACGGQPLRVLFIGNSHTYVNDLPWLIEQLASSANEARRLETGMVAAGGATLKSHWESGRALDAIKVGRWDYVVLQEQSGVPLNEPELMHKYARLFDAEIRRAGARTVFYLAWSRQARPETQAALTDAYTSIARELNARIAPVGIAWQRALQENPKLVLYFQDGSHAGPAGSYLAACVFYSVFYGKSPVGLSRRLFSTQFGTAKEGARVEVEGLSEPAARAIQSAAWHAVSDMEKGKWRQAKPRAAA